MRPGGTGTSPDRPQIYRMQMDEIETVDRPGESPAHRRRPVEAPQVSAREISDLHPLDVDRLKQRHVAIGRTVNTGRENVDVVATLRQRPAKRVHGSDRAAV